MDEAFGLAVGLGSIGPGSEMTQVQLLADASEPTGYVTGAVVGHDGLDSHSTTPEPSDRASKEGGRGRGSLVGQHFGVGQTGGIVDRDVDELPPDAADTSGAITVDAVADAADASELLDIDVDQFPRALLLVSDDGLSRFQTLSPRQTRTGQDPSHGGRAQADPRGDLRTCISSPSQTQNLTDSQRMGLPRHSVRPRTPIDQRRLAGLSISRLPLKRRPPRYTSRLGGAGRAHPLKHPSNQEHSTGRATSGILVQLHLGSSVELVALDTSSLTDLGPDGQQTLPVNNALRIEN